MNRWLPRVRGAMERMGPAGLQHGELNDRPLFDTIVQILPGGREAISRGIELGMLGEADKRTAHWELTVFRNRFVKEGGLWKLKERVKTNGFSAVGASPLTGAIKTTRAAARPAVSSATLSERLVEARRRWARSMAYDGTENVSSAYGYYIDDFQWPQMGACSQLTWSHYRALMRVADQAARSWYVQEAAAQGWPVRTLLRQISSFAYERTLRSDKPAAAGRRRRKQPEQPSIEPRDFIKDPYVLEFLEVKDHAGLHESRFEQAIIDRLSGVHARAGKGFCFCRSPVRTRFSTRAGSYSRPSTAHIFRRSLQCVKPPAPGNRTPPGAPASVTSQRCPGFASPYDARFPAGRSAYGTHFRASIRAAAA